LTLHRVVAEHPGGAARRRVLAQLAHCDGGAGRVGVARVAAPHQGTRGGLLLQAGRTQIIRSHVIYHGLVNDARYVIHRVSIPRVFLKLMFIDPQGALHGEQLVSYVRVY
jgi:hypothetical protein